MDIEDFLNRYETITAQIEESATQRLNAALDAAYKQIEAQLKAKYPALASNDSMMVTKDAIIRFNQLKSALALINPQNAAQIESGFQEVLQLANEQGDTLAQKLVESMASSDIVQPGQVALEAAAFAAKDSVTRLSRYSQDFQNAAATIVTQGIVQGWGTAKVASLLRNQLGITKGKAELIARTEVLSSFNQAAAACYANSGIEYVQVVATGDLRTCGLCVARNLKVYPIKSVSVPWHPRCRCALMPWSQAWSQDTSWLKKYHSQVLNQFEGTLNKGVGPFEKMSGLTHPPEAVWTPDELTQPA